jgi:hypothetical protein
MKRVQSYARSGGVFGSVLRGPAHLGRIAPISHALAAAAVLSLVLPIALAITTEAVAQHSGAASSAPPPPAGNGTLTVRVIHPANPSEAAGLTIALYALSSDGTPGFANGETDAEGVFTFSGISTDPSIVYLVGARFQEIPFGERVTFAEDETEANVEIKVMAPTDQIAGVAIEELRIRIDWMGGRIILRELLRFSNAGDRVIQLPADDRSRSIVARPLGPTASNFSAGSGSIGDGLTLEEGQIRFWGPLYPGEQRIEYQYSLPLPSEGGALRVPVELSEAAARVVVVAGTTGLKIQGTRLIASSDLQSDTGKSLKAWARAGLAAGESFDINLTLPESRLDPTLLSVSRSDVWLELDDTRLTATIDIQIEVEPGAPVAGSPDAPLLHVSIPSGATLQGVAPEAEALGLIPTGDPSGDDVGFDVVGPIGPGTTSLGYSFVMPARPEGVELDMRFPGNVETLNVLIADTGLALDSSRLHRRRPFRSGTRNYLHREAFNIDPDEIVDLSLAPIGATGPPQSVSIGLAIAAAAAGAFFMFAPLRRVERDEATHDSPLDGIRAKRELVYTAIRDLDHDFETAKLEQDDYTQMRDRLRSEAIELLRAEREATAQEALAAGPSGVAGGTSVSTANEPKTGAYCPTCGKAVTANWRFCSHCGGNLYPTQEEDS